jgi:hypothetical protein
MTCSEACHTVRSMYRRSSFTATSRAPHSQPNSSLSLFFFSRSVHVHTTRSSRSGAASTGHMVFLRCVSLLPVPPKTSVSGHCVQSLAVAASLVPASPPAVTSGAIIGDDSSGVDNSGGDSSCGCCCGGGSGTGIAAAGAETAAAAVAAGATAASAAAGALSVTGECSVVRLWL